MRVFVSHAGRDRNWAEWAAAHLRAAGIEVEVDLEWDGSFVEKMERALDACTHMIALYSPDYFGNRHTMQELRAWVAARDDQGLIPLRIAECEIPVLYGHYIYRDLFGISTEKAREILLGALGRAATPPPADDAGPRVPDGPPPAIWKVPARNPDFVGRDDLIIALHDRLATGNRAVVQALHGFGGVGKTSLATEYAHRFAGEYDIVWWVDSQRPELIAEQFSDLAVRLNLVPLTTATPAAAAAAKDHLRPRRRWLIILDNAEQPEDIAPWLPGGGGHVIITSRRRTWRGVAAAVEVDVFTRAESVELLTTQAGVSAADADELARTLGDLPLAIAQAAGLLADTGMPAAFYLRMVTDHALRAMEQGHAQGYPLPLAGSISASLTRLAEADPVALAMVKVCALLAPEPVRVDWFLNPTPDKRLPALRSVDAARAYQAAGVLGAFGLARPGEGGLLLHRLTQAVIADWLPEAERAEVRAAAAALVLATRPRDFDDPRWWPTWQAILPHLVALDPATSTDPDLRWAGIGAAWYLDRRGDYQGSLDLSRRLHAAFAAKLGDGHADTLAAAGTLANAHRRVGDFAAARALLEQVLAIRRRTLGDNDSPTLTSAHNLAATLLEMGELEAARDLLEPTLAASRRVRGADHISTLRAASILAQALQRLGELIAARELYESTLAAQRRVLGDDHPDALLTTHDLAITRWDLGELAAARDLLEATLTARRRVLGDDHPYTRLTATNLANLLRELGETAAAERLEAEFPRHRP